MFWSIFCPLVAKLSRTLSTKKLSMFLMRLKYTENNNQFCQQFVFITIRLQPRIMIPNYPQVTGELGINTSHSETKKKREMVLLRTKKKCKRKPSVIYYVCAAAFKAADLCTSQSPHSSGLYARDGHSQRSHLNLHSHYTSTFLFCKVSITFLKGGGRGAASHCRSRETFSLPW